MTSDEFVEAYSEGLRALLSSAGLDKGEAHIEDLAANTMTYSESVFQFVSALPRTKPCDCDCQKKKKS